jgi:hypothetical protein
MPKTLDAFCEQRGSICVTPLGRGPDGWYYDEAEVDFWEVWNRVATSYRLDPLRTAISGYSMGGFGTYKLGNSYPDLFAASVPMAAAVWCDQTSANTRCAKNYNTYEMLDNARWLPTSVFQGGVDEFGLVVDNSIMTQKLDDLGFRYRYEVYPSEGHNAWILLDNLGTAAQYLDGTVQPDPGHVTYRWYPDLAVPKWGIGPTGAWWISGLESDAAPGALAEVDAVSLAHPDPLVTVTKGAEPVALSDGTPGVARTQQWQVGATPAAEPAIHLTLTGVTAVTVDLTRAGLTGPGTVTVTSDRPVTVTLSRGKARSSHTLPAGGGTIATR